MNRRSIAALVGAGTLLAGAGVAAAAIPDSDGVIYAWVGLLLRSRATSYAN